MSEINRIHDQLRRSYQGIAWHGPSLTEILKGVDEDLAGRRAGDAHTIRELVRHIAAWERITAQALGGAEYPDAPPQDIDWPRALTSFDADLKQLEDSHRALEAAVESFPESRLKEKVFGNREYSYYFLLHGVIQHNLYHAGQIAILKRILA